MRSEWRKDYFTLRHVLRRTGWLWVLGIGVALLWFL